MRDMGPHTISPLASGNALCASDELARALRDTCERLDEARTLPRTVYTDEATFATECRELFPHSWLAVAREEDLPEVGSFVTHEIAGERILVVRSDAERLHAFYNVCRHRGSRLVQEAAGQLRGAIACPYHAWTYALDGRFKRAPRLEVDAARAETLALTTLALATWAGFVFINLDASALPFSEQGSALPDVARFRLSALRRARRLDYEIGANWKIVCENYSECYHCPLVHPQLDRLCDLTSGAFESGANFNGGPMQLRAGFDTLSISGRSSRPRLCVTNDADSRLVYYYLVYPNLMLGVHPDYLVTHSVWPLAPDRSHIVCQLFFAPEALDAADFDPDEVSQFWDRTNRQDWALCERVQQGAASRGYRPGPYHPSERCVHAFDRWYAGWLMAFESSAENK